MSLSADLLREEFNQRPLGLPPKRWWSWFLIEDPDSTTPYTSFSRLTKVTKLTVMEVKTWWRWRAERYSQLQHQVSSTCSELQPTQLNQKLPVLRRVKTVRGTPRCGRILSLYICMKNKNESSYWSKSDAATTPVRDDSEWTTRSLERHVSAFMT